MSQNYKIIFLLLFSFQIISAQNSFLSQSEGYKANDVLEEYTYFSGFAIQGDTLFGNASDSIIGLTLSNGDLIFNSKRPSEYTAYTSFIKEDPTGDFLWAGYTTDGNTDDRIYRISIQSGEWEQMSTFPGNMDIDFNAGHTLVSGLNSSDWTAPNAIFLLDTSVLQNHRKIIDIGGSSTGFSTSSDGSVFVATSFFTSQNGVYKWDSALIHKTISETDSEPLTTEDATLLTSIPAGAYDCEADIEGTPVFTFNTYQGDKVVAAWNGNPGSGNNYDTIAYTDGEYDWLTYLHCEGSIHSHHNGRVYAFSWGRPVTELRAVYSPFIHKVHEYVPAPGQHINHTAGSPAAARTIVGGVDGNVSLGAFGGYIVFSFDGPVQNDPGNPFGVDFTIFGNPLPAWAEHGIVSVMPDDNKNGLPDDTWYELAGSDYFFSYTRKQYEVTYNNPGGSEAKDVSWTDNQGHSGSVLAGGYYSHSLYPTQDSFPNIDQQSYTLSGTCLPDQVNRSNPAQYSYPVKPFGYADNNPLGDAPYTLPDNPYSDTIENSGGDAFDISWAVDADGNYVDLPSIDFVKVHTGVLANADWLGEVSTEIRGAVDVVPAAATDPKSMIVVADMPDTIRGNSYQLEAMFFEQGIGLHHETIYWDSNLEGATVSEDHLLTFNTSGDLTLEAYLAYDPQIRTAHNVVLEHTTGIESNTAGYQNLTVYPNPANDYVHVQQKGLLEVYNISGQMVRLEYLNEMDTPLYVGDLVPGLYLIKLTNNDRIHTSKLKITNH
ncbi:MAG TPA: T9SS type A sorting domain-containing protein [Bacteroidales bacterium]|nr:T9SS type A sorting domain-containing protein [Bacteroidales bacterium]